MTFDESQVMRAVEAVAVGDLADRLFSSIAREAGIEPTLRDGESPLLIIGLAIITELPVSA